MFLKGNNLTRSPFSLYKATPSFWIALDKRFTFSINSLIFSIFSVEFKRLWIEGLFSRLKIKSLASEDVFEMEASALFASSIFEEVTSSMVSMMPWPCLLSL